MEHASLQLETAAPIGAVVSFSVRSRPERDEVKKNGRLREAASYQNSEFDMVDHAEPVKGIPLDLSDLEAAAAKAEIRAAEALAEEFGKPFRWVKGRAIAIAENVVTVDFGPRYGQKSMDSYWLKGRDTIWVDPRYFGRFSITNKDSKEPKGFPSVAEWCAN